MTELTGLNLNPDVEESTGEFVVVPAGKYKACLVDDELRDNKKGTGKVLAIKVQIIEGNSSGVTIDDYINITNASPKCQTIGQGTLRRICNLCGVVYPLTDTAGLMGKPIGIDVKVEEFKSNKADDEGNFKTLKCNKIRAYGPVPTTQQTQQKPAEQTAPGEW